MIEDGGMTGVSPDLPPLDPPSDWTAPRRTLIIAATPRSGSNWLADAIGATAVMGRPEEWFGWWRTERTRERTVAAAYDVATRGATPNGVAGVKLLPYYLESALRHVRLTRWFPDAIWVHLVRRDLLGQAISLWRAHSSGEWALYGPAKERRLNARVPAARAGFDPLPDYDPAVIEGYLKLAASFQADWLAFFARTGITPLTLVYEEIVADRAGTLATIADALGVALPPGPAADTGRFTVQRDETTHAIRERFRADFGDPDRPIRLLSGVERDGVPTSGSRRPPAVASVVRWLRGRALRPR
jgi:LPS sulfotransferase NodH